MQFDDYKFSGLTGKSKVLGSWQFQFNNQILKLKGRQLKRQYDYADSNSLFGRAMDTLSFSRTYKYHIKILNDSLLILQNAALHDIKPELAPDLIFRNENY